VDEARDVRAGYRYKDVAGRLFGGGNALTPRLGALVDIQAGEKVRRHMAPVGVLPRRDVNAGDSGFVALLGRADEGGHGWIRHAQILLAAGNLIASSQAMNGEEVAR
jgi:hypothetical protein